MTGKNNWELDDIAEQISRAVNNALDSKNFEQLNRRISDTVESALDEARSQFHRYCGGLDGPVRGGNSSGASSAGNAGAGGTWYAKNAGTGGAGYAGNAGASFTGYRRTTGSRAETERGAWRSRYRTESAGGTSAYHAANRQTVPNPMSVRVNWRGQASGIAMGIFGGIGVGVFGIAALILLLIALIVTDGAALWGIAGFMAILTGLSGVLLGVGISRSGRVNRLRQYLGEIRRNGKPYYEIKRLCQVCGRDEKFVKNDIRKMLQLGMLPDARIDDTGTCLMLNDETYRQYLQARESLKIRQEEEQAAKAREDAIRRGLARTGTDSAAGSGRKASGARTGAGGGEKDGGAGAADGTDEAVKQAVARGKEYMALLDNLREAMPACVMTEKLLRLDTVLERLFGTLEKYPDQLDELEKFMEYYLPTTVKLVTAYREFALVEFPGDNIKSAKKEIEETMDTINGAFEKLLDDMYEDTTFDVITDASVLQAMLAREGLTESDFKETDK